jgi:hypothetical protein
MLRLNGKVKILLPLLKPTAESDAEEAEGTFILKDITSVDQDFECINC